MDKEKPTQQVPTGAGREAGDPPTGYGGREPGANGDDKKKTDDKDGGDAPEGQG